VSCAELSSKRLERTEVDKVACMWPYTAAAQPVR
jgi:hypothetical protein